MLILAATPIGNIGDASPRLIEAITSAKYIAAEDTRTTLKLAGALGISLGAKLFSMHEHNEAGRLDHLLELAETSDVLVLSDAGMPTVSDPGYLLVREAVARGIDITVIPGPSAVLAALAVSGLATDRFCFEGFLGRKSTDRLKQFEALRHEARTMVFFESPHRIEESLLDAINVFGPDRQAAVCRELTKRFEQTKRGTLAELHEWAAEGTKGELVLVVAGGTSDTADLAQVASLAVEKISAGEPTSAVVQELAKIYNVSKNELYDLVLQLKPKQTKSGKPAD